MGRCVGESVFRQLPAGQIRVSARGRAAWMTVQSGFRRGIGSGGRCSTAHNEMTDQKMCCLLIGHWFPKYCWPTKPKFAAIMEAHLFKEKPRRQAAWRGWREWHIFQISISQFYALCSLWGEAAWPRLITIRYETGKALFPQQFTACIPLRALSCLVPLPFISYSLPPLPLLARHVVTFASCANIFMGN